MEEIKNIENFDWELLTKYINNEVNSREKLEVESWLNTSEKNREELEKTRQMLEKTDVYFKNKPFDSRAAWNNVHSKIHPAQFEIVQHKKTRKEAILRFYKYAAILLIALLLGSITYIGFKNQIPVLFIQSVSAESQVVNNYVLPDGSVVTLNRNSTLHFPKHFNKDVREVTITGEAFFDVEPNASKPFIINAGDVKVKVLGTSFNVCAYPETETVEVVVETGKVQVTRKNAGTEIENWEVFLLPGEIGILFSKTQVLEKSANMDPNIISWKTHDLVFNEVPLSEVIRCLKKVYNVDIHVEEPGLNDLVLTAHFDKKPLDFILNVVRLTFNLELSEENKQFTLSGRTKNQ
jgi:ferric-dicitrate binding protein FerR (iron transport regulator)